MTIGVDLQPTEIRVGVVEAGVIYKMNTIPFPSNGTEIETINYLIRAVSELMNTNIKGIGVGVSSFVDAKEGIVYNARNIPSWREVHLKDVLETEFHVPVCVNNDSNCFAFGERYYGECTAYRSIVGIIMGTGLGAGLIINDMLYEGATTSAGEIGSLPYLDMDYEGYCASAFFKRHNTSIEIALSGAQAGDENALDIWNEFGVHVGNLIKTVLFTYDPQSIILGGDISRGFKFFSGTMYEEIMTYPYNQAINTIEVLVSHKENIGLIGAAGLIP